MIANNIKFFSPKTFEDAGRVWTQGQVKASHEADFI